jgi:DNA repair protein RadC
MKYKSKIKDLPRIERPREKLIKYGPEKLSNEELLAILLRVGRKGENVISLSTKILQKFNDKNLSEIGFSELKNISGLGPVKSCEIVACFELGKRFLANKKSSIIMTPKDVFIELREIAEKKKEHFVVIYLDARNQEIKKEVVSIGTINTSLVHPREVFEPAVKNLASHIIIAHNHPSGNVEPSDDDLEVTKRLKSAGELLGIEIIDHIIVSKEKYYSFKEGGKL